VETLRKADAAIRVVVIRDFSTGYHARNGGGDTIQTDGDLPVVDLRRVLADGAPVPGDELNADEQVIELRGVS
jgi:hypothetical protein